MFMPFFLVKYHGSRSVGSVGMGGASFRQEINLGARKSGDTSVDLVQNE